MTLNERKNIDLIREAEAKNHGAVQPGDLRFWIDKEIPDDKIRINSDTNWSVMIAEFEAIHGKTFPEQEWLQKYFDERYWYERNPNYSPTMLSAIEHKNLDKFIAKRNEQKNPGKVLAIRDEHVKIQVSFGNMDKFQTVLLKEEQLEGVRLNELRLMRNEFYARRGKRFKTDVYQQIFEQEDWYKPLKNQAEVKLNATEEANVKLLIAYETKMREKITTEVLTEDFFDGMYAEDLRLLRNEIFARHGKVFKDAHFQKYFEAQPWYKADATFTDENAKNILSETEIKNITTIELHEEDAISKFALVPS